VGRLRGSNKKREKEQKNTRPENQYKGRYWKKAGEEKQPSYKETLNGIDRGKTDCLIRWRKEGGNRRGTIGKRIPRGSVRIPQGSASIRGRSGRKQDLKQKGLWPTQFSIYLRGEGPANILKKGGRTIPWILIIIGGGKGRLGRKNIPLVFLSQKRAMRFLQKHKKWSPRLPASKGIGTIQDGSWGEKHQVFEGRGGAGTVNIWPVGKKEALTCNKGGEGVFVREKSKKPGENIKE